MKKLICLLLFSLAGNAFGSFAVPDNSVTTAKIVNGAVTQAKRAALGQQVSLSSGQFSTTGSTNYVSVTNLSVTITTTGRPVFVALIPDGTTVVAGSGSPTDTWLGCAATGGCAVDYNILRGATPVFGYHAEGGASHKVPASLFGIDVVAAGTYTYTVQMALMNAAYTGYLWNAKLIAYEL